MSFGFGKSTADAHDHAFALLSQDSVGNEHGAVVNHPIDGDLVVAGIEQEVGDWKQQKVSPFFKFQLRVAC